MITPPSHRAILPIAPRPLPQPSPYPSPRSAEPMRRRNSFSYSFEDHARPPLRTAFSAAEGPGSGGGGLMLRMGSEEKEDFHDGWDGGDLTTKGRKRKRLAKACSACHKNKRRCDGFAPCSNCEFSSRPCLYLNAQGEEIPPPRTRDPSSSTRDPRTPILTGGTLTPRLPVPQVPVTATAVPATPILTTPLPSAQSHPQVRSQPQYKPVPVGVVQGYETGRGRVVTSPEEWRDVVDVERDPAVQAELIDLFFTHLHPYTAIFHPPTFHHRLYLNLLSPFLLFSIYALSARISPVYASHASTFADRARSHLRTTRLDLPPSTWEETEFVQSLLLLAVYDGRDPLARDHLDHAFSILRPTASGSLPRTQSGGSVEELTLAETRVRTFWVMCLHDMVNAQRRRYLEGDVRLVPLPASESSWVRYGGATSGAGWGRRDGLVVGTGEWMGEEGAVGELGQTLRITAIFADIMGVANPGPAHADTRLAAQLEHALKAWALSLPATLRFDEPNLSRATAQLTSTVPNAALSGWLFAFMHSVAECGMFYLQAAVAQMPPTNLDRGLGPGVSSAVMTAQRQSQAVDNVAVVLGVVGERGRSSPMMLLPLSVASNWSDHLRNSSVPPSPQQAHLSTRLPGYWRHHRSLWPQLSSSIPRQIDSVSSSSTITLPTPRGPTLPPLVGTSPTHIRNLSGGSTSTSGGGGGGGVVLPPLKWAERGEPLGIAALVSAAEEERERISPKRE